MSEPKKEMKRRTFLGSAAKGGALVGLGAVAGFAASRIPSHIRRQRQARPPLGDDFFYDVEAFLKTDPKLIGYREASRFDPEFRIVRGIESGPEGKIYVAGDRQVRGFSADGHKVSEFNPSELPQCVASTGDELYVGLKSHVEVYDRSGKLKASWERQNSRSVFKSIAVSKNNVFVADAGNRVVLRYDRSGKLLHEIGKKDPNRNIPGFVVPSPYLSLGVGPDGLLRVTNPGRHQVETYTFDGHLEFSWGKPSMAIDGFCGCCNPVSLAVLADGSIVTCEKGLPRVKVYDTKGKFQKVVAGTEQFPDTMKVCRTDALLNSTRGGLDVAADAKGRIFVLEWVGRNVRVMEKKA